MLREIKTRFGAYRLGIVWALVEPLTHVVVLSLIFGIRSRTAPGAVEFPIFLATGIIPFVMFRNMVTRTMMTVEANRALFTYPQVRPFDTLIARFILEIVIYSIVFVVFMVGAALVLNLRYKPIGEGEARYLDTWTGKIHAVEAKASAPLAEVEARASDRSIEIVMLERLYRREPERGTCRGVRFAFPAEGSDAR